MNVRSFWRAAKVDKAQPPYDTIHLKVLYPSAEPNANQMFLAANSELAPFPIVIFFNGGNCSLDSYQWLGIELVKKGTVVILFNWVAEYLPGIFGLLPGFDEAARKPDIYGTIPTSTVIFITILIFNY